MAEFKYRSDIDGLRAIAVLAVLFFHAEVPFFSGGFVGVDVFFVISGYLITSIILKEISNTGKFSIARFYERRIRRIFPALFPVMLFVLMAGAYLFDADAFKDLGESITATTLFSSNILFGQESGYFAAPSLQKPLLHTWSLAVEEQFYIVFPLVLAAIARWQKSRYLPFILMAFVFSFGASIYGVFHDSIATFYLVPTRSWELLTGSILALGVLPTPSTAWQKNLIGFSGILLIGLSIFFYNDATPFPGFTALAPVVGSAMIIWSGMGGGAYTLKNLLSSRILVFFGLISYSLYLWHWPLVAFWKYLSIRNWTVVDSIAIVTASILLASLSWKFIELPFRGNAPLFPQRKKLFVLSAAVMLAAITIGQVIKMHEGMSCRMSRFYPEIGEVIMRAKNDPRWESQAKWEDNTKNFEAGVVPPVIGKKNTTPTFALVGDSHARALISALDSESNKMLNAGYAITYDGTPAVSDFDVTVPPLGVNRSDWVENVLGFIDSHKNIEIVVLAGRWGLYSTGQWSGPDIDTQKKLRTIKQLDKNESVESLFNKGLKKTVISLLAMNRKVVLVSSIPEIGYNVPNVYVKCARWPDVFDLNTVRPSVEEYNERQKKANAIMEELAKLPGVTIIRPEKILFDNQGKGKVIDKGELLYRDDDHLSLAGALYVAPVFHTIFSELGSNKENR